MKKTIATLAMASSLAISGVAGAGPLTSRYLNWVNHFRPVVQSWLTHNRQLIADVNIGDSYAVSDDLNNMAGDVLAFNRLANSPDYTTNVHVKQLARDAARYVLYVNNTAQGNNNGSQIGALANAVARDEQILTNDITRDNRIYR